MRTPLLLLGVAILACILPSIPANGDNSKSTAVDKWIADLDSTRFNARQRASKEILALKEAAIQPLKAALRNPNRSLEQRRRLEQLLSEARVFEHEGEAYNGLRLILNTSNDTLKLGEQMTIVTTLCNVGKESLIVPIGRQFPDSDFALGSNLRCLTDQLQFPRFTTPRKRELFTILLPAGQSQAFSTVVKLCNNINQKNVLALDLGFGDGSLEVGANASIRLRTVHTVEPTEALLRSLERDRVNPKSVWTGTVRSDDVVVKLIAD